MTAVDDAPSTVEVRPADDWARWELEGVIADRIRRAFQLAGWRDRRDPLAFSMSKLGGCRRESAYRLAGSPASEPVPLVRDDVDEKRAAWLGTWIHRGLVPMLRLSLAARTRSESKVALSSPGAPDVPGRLDLYWPKHGGVLVDVKTVKEWALNRVRATDARAKDQWQQDGYAAALVQDGRPVAWIATVYVDRASGETETVVRAFDEARYDAVLDRMGMLTELARDPDSAPRDEPGPGLSPVCDGCPWLRRCWGDTARPGDTAAVAILPDGVDEAEVAQLLAEYVTAQVAEAEAKKAKEAAKARVRLLPARTYGDYELGWTGQSRGGSTSVSKTAAALEKAGVDVTGWLKAQAEAAGVEVVTTAPTQGSIKVARRSSTA